jgi:hypothetical protein
LTCTSSASSAQTRGSSLTRDPSGTSRTGASSRLGLGSGASAAGGGQCEQRPGGTGAAGLVRSKDARSRVTQAASRKPVAQQRMRGTEHGGADDGGGGWRRGTGGGQWRWLVFLSPEPTRADTCLDGQLCTTVLSYMTAAPVGGRSWADGRCGMRAPHVSGGTPHIPHRSPSRFV